MVKSVQAEEAVGEHFDGLIRNRVEVEAGVLVGKKAVGARDLLLAVIPTPLQDGHEVATISKRAAGSASKAKKGGSIKAPEVQFDIQLEQDWMAEHARQLHRMLPGGISILGFYIFCPDSGFASASQQLCSAFSTFLSDIAPPAAAAAGTSSKTSGADSPTFLVLHADAMVKKYNMKSCPVPSGASAALASSLKPCELKFGGWVNNLVCLQTTHKLLWSLPAISSKSTLHNTIQKVVDLEAQRVMAAVAEVEGQLFQPATDGSSSNSILVADGLPAGSLNQPVKVDLYAPPPGSCAPSVTAKSQTSCGLSKLAGQVVAVAYVHKREPAAKALEDLKADVSKTLRVRLELLADEAAAAAEEEEEQGSASSGPAAGEQVAAQAAHPLLEEAASSKRVAVPFPRRVLLPWLAGVKLCDYLLDGEASTAACERADELVGLREVSADQVEEVEQPASSALPKKVKGSPAPASASGASSSSCSPALLAGTAAAVAVAVLGIAAVSLSGSM